MLLQRHNPDAPRSGWQAAFQGVFWSVECACPPAARPKRVAYTSPRALTILGALSSQHAELTRPGRRLLSTRDATTAIFTRTVALTGLVTPPAGA